jgi:hypothetical protein
MITFCLQWTVHKGRRLELFHESHYMYIDNEVWPAHGSTPSHLPVHLDVTVYRKALEFLVQPALTHPGLNGLA